MVPLIEQLTTIRYDLQFGTNVPLKRSTCRNYILRLRHYYFTKLLSPTLFSTAKISPDGNVRIVNTSSMGYMFCCGIDFFQRFKEAPARKKKGLSIFVWPSILVRLLSSTYTNIHVIK